MSSKIHIPLDRGVMEPKDIMVTIRGGGELLLVYINTYHSRKWSTKFIEGPSKRSYRSSGNFNNVKM